MRYAVRYAPTDYERFLALAPGARMRDHRGAEWMKIAARTPGDTRDHHIEGFVVSLDTGVITHWSNILPKPLS